MTIFTAAFLPVLISLGLWQLDREQEKQALQALYAQRQNTAAIPLEAIDWSDADLSYTKMEVTGQFDNSRYFLLDNRIREGRAGYEVLMPLFTEGGKAVIVNRGWIGQGDSRTELPSLPPLHGSVNVQGTLYVPLSEPFVLSDIQEAGSADWPRVVQKIDIPAWSSVLDRDVVPFTMRMAQGSPGALEASWQTINMLPEKHRGYAVQWFAMTLALVLMYLYFGMRNHPNHKEDE